MDTPNGPSAAHSAERLALWRRARHAELCERRVGGGEGAIGQPDVLEGPGFLYRSRQVLFGTGTAAAQRIEDRLKAEGGDLHRDLADGFRTAKLPVQAYVLPPEVDIPRLVAQLRERPYRELGEPVPNVSPNYVFCGEADYHGGPYGEPLNAAPFPETQYVGTAQGAPEIAVLDTGYDAQALTLHAGLNGRLVVQGQPENPLTPAGDLAQEGGHGTFIDGVIMQLAPEVRIRQVHVLSPAGVTDDACLALAISGQAGAPVINVSLGGYTQQDVPPTASGAAIAALTDSVVVVAAAGNNGSSEPFWPAAFNNVVAVGALDTTQDPPQRAVFSNFGSWVDVYAPGVNVYSTYLDATWKLPTDPNGWPIDGWATWSGTSFAAPQVAAAIANALQSGGTARQAAYAVLAAAPWVPTVGPGYIPPGPGVIFPA
jgi:Subtilase family